MSRLGPAVATTSDDLDRLAVNLKAEFRGGGLDRAGHAVAGNFGGATARRTEQNLEDMLFAGARASKESVARFDAMHQQIGRAHV